GRSSESLTIAAVSSSERGGASSAPDFRTTENGSWERTSDSAGSSSASANTPIRCLPSAAGTLDGLLADRRGTGSRSSCGAGLLAMDAYPESYLSEPAMTLQRIDAIFPHRYCVYEL